MVPVKKLVDCINRKIFYRLLFFFVLTILAVFWNGYHFGTFDQVFHIPFLKAWNDPTLYPGDPFIGLREYYFSYFWFLLMPFYKAGCLEIAVFVMHLIVTFLTFCAFWELTAQLFHNPLANVLVSLMIVVPHIGFPGFQIIEFSLLNRTFAIPFLLFAIVFYLRKQYFWAFLLSGLMFDIHLLYAGFVLAMFGLDLLLNLKSINWKQLLPALLIFVIVVLPLFLRKSGVERGYDFNLDPKLEYLESMSMGYNVHKPIGPQLYVWMGTLQGIACLAIVYIAMERRKDHADDRSLRNFIRASLILIAFATVAAYWLPVTFIVQLQLVRVGVFLLYFAYIYLAGMIADAYAAEEINKPAAIVMALASVFLVAPMGPLLFWFLIKHFRKNPGYAIGLAAVTTLLLGEILIALAGNYFAPGFYIFGPETDWVDAQKWAKVNTPRDAKFVTPPYVFGEYEADWRVFSERGAVATIPEIEVLHLNPAYITGFEERFETLAPGVLAKLDGDYNHFRNATKTAFLSLNDLDYATAGDKYNADFLVLPNEKPSQYKKLYSNPSYTIYALP